MPWPVGHAASSLNNFCHAHCLSALWVDMEVSLAEIAAQQAGRPDRQMLTVGVIGSAGKTTTSLLISALLRSASIRTAYQTDLGESDGIVQTTSNSKIPNNRELVHWLAEAKDSQCKAAVIEMSETEARHGNYDAISVRHHCDLQKQHLTLTTLVLRDCSAALIAWQTMVL